MEGRGGWKQDEEKGHELSEEIRGSKERGERKERRRCGYGGGRENQKLRDEGRWDRARRRGSPVECSLEQNKISRARRGLNETGGEGLLGKRKCG